MLFEGIGLLSSFFNDGSEPSWFLPLGAGLLSYLRLNNRLFSGKLSLLASTGLCI